MTTIWPVMLITVVLVIVYLLIVTVFSTDIKQYSAPAQVVIILVTSILYIIGYCIYFALKFPTLF